MRRGQLVVASLFAFACATGVEPEGRGNASLDGGSGTDGFGGSGGASGSGAGAGVFGASGAAGAGGSAAFGVGGSLGRGGASGSGGTGGFGGSLGGDGGGFSGSGGTSGAAGVAGVSGSAGTAGSGGSGGTAPTHPCAAAAADAGTGEVKLQMINTGNPSDQSIAVTLNIVNLTSSSIPLTELTARYWYTKEPTEPEQFLNCDYAEVGAGNVTTGAGVFTAVDPARPNADHYFELGFTAGTLGANDDTGQIQLRMHAKDHNGTYTETNDHSFCQASAFTDWDRVTVYRDGNLVWGIEP